MDICDAYLYAKSLTCIQTNMYSKIRFLSPDSIFWKWLVIDPSASAIAELATEFLSAKKLASQNHHHIQSSENPPENI